MNRPTRTVPEPHIEEATVEEAHNNNVPAMADPRSPSTAAEIKPVEEVHHEFAPTPLGNIAGAIASIMAEIKPVEKEGFNKFQGYKYARMQDLSRELTPLMGKHGIVIFQTEVGRELFDGGAAIAVRYRFTISHKSGEVWPEHPIQTGLSSCRNTKGGFDDKALNKCHTSARKYFLLSLFQIPTADEDDADSGAGEGDDTGSGPKQSRPRRQVPAPNGKIAPHVIPVSAGEHPQDWAARFLAFVAKAETDPEIDDWYNTNGMIMEKIRKHDDGKAVMDSIIAGMDARAAALNNVEFTADKAAAAQPVQQQAPQQRATPQPQRTAPPPPARQQAKPPADDLEIPAALRRTKKLTPPSVENVEEFFQFIAKLIEDAPDMEAVESIWNEYVFLNTDGNGRRDDPKILPPDLEALHDLVDQKKEQLGL